MYIIGIDPGISGAICFFKNGKIIDVIEMPSMAEGKKIKSKLMETSYTMKLNYAFQKLISMRFVLLLNM